MKDRVKELVRLLNLAPHPEGGLFAEVFRSPTKVKAKRGRRTAITTIYFLLRRGEGSRWHRVASDEIWHFIEGAPLKLHHVRPDFTGYQVHRVGPFRGRSKQPLAIIPAGDWQAAESSGDYTLVACDVGPGFDFADFEMARDDGASTARLRRRWPKLARLA